jgi:hypothetical protein
MRYEVVAHRGGEYVGTRRVDAESANQALEIVRSRSRTPGELTWEAEAVDDRYDEYDEYDEDD